MSKKILFRVEGTTCGSCEVLLERAFRKLPGVSEVDVSNRSGLVTLTVDDGRSLSVSDLEKAAGDSKYRFYRPDGPRRSSVPGRINWLRGIMVFALAFSLYLVFFRSGILPTGASLDSSAGLAAVFFVGLVAAFSSCSAVVGGLVAAVAASAPSGQSLMARFRPHLLFNLGRVIGFAVLGGAIGGLGDMVGLSTGLNGLFLLVVAAIMVGVGFGLSGVFAGGSVFGLSKRIARLVERRAGSGQTLTVMGLGAATFFLPCGFTQSMQLLAASSGSVLGGAVIMLVFSLGTAPALLGLGLAAGSAAGRFRNYLSMGIGVFVVAVGFSNFAGAAMLLDTGSAAVPTETAAVKSALIRMEGNEQVIQMEVTSGLEYAPDTLYVQAGIPVKWSIYGSDRMGCASSLVLREFGVRTTLRPGFNEVRFVPSRPGTYRFTCSMGMTRGTMVVLPAKKSSDKR
ncbi:MAG: sulfite exporter TauE/SafE family protein [bacterium]